MKPLILALLLLFVSLLGHANVQTSPKPETNRCALSVAESPTVRGLKLGQSFSDVKSLFAEEAEDELARISLGFDAVRPDELGVSEQLISSTILGLRSDRLKGTRDISLRYLDGRLASIKIYYDSSVQWKDSSYFAAAVAEQLHLPNNAWKNDGISVRLDCDGFYVGVLAYVTNQLTIARSDLDTEIKQRRAKYQQQKRVEFKP